jgi:hypothetical protein
VSLLRAVTRKKARYNLRGRRGEICGCSDVSCCVMKERKIDMARYIRLVTDGQMEDVWRVRD